MKQYTDQILRLTGNLQSGLLDSYALIQLLSKLEDSGIELHPTRIDRTKLRTVKGIVELIEEYYKQASKK